ncbi:uncharacterized protein LOC111397174 [Olea europaea var. sylvestris]|uniref:uncharacterized protein LOC111397174 n=1 Tax=Olea europaea var. sylvestris TaxID=158386 RepID=UPI000C1D0F18|nr:uncharacterized protein LOC111397174 [Olea europaea var. sylvestris]
MMSIVEKNIKEIEGRGLIDVVFSWSIGDVMNKDLYRNKVERIPETFYSEKHYLRSFNYPLIEETHAGLRSSFTSKSRPPAREIFDVNPNKDFRPPKDLFYTMTLKGKSESEEDKGVYEPEVGDLIALTDVRPKYIDDLYRRPYNLAVLYSTKDDDSTKFSVISSKPIVFDMQDRDELFAVYLINLTTNIRIWQALNPNQIGENMKIIKSVLRVNPSFEETCTVCSVEESITHESTLRESIGSFGMNDSQVAAILNCIVTRECHHRNDVKLIWGPPGTGKTKTISSLLFALLRMKCRTLTCAPTNVAVIGVATKLLSLLSDKLLENTYGLGDIVLFGNGERMKIDDNEDLYNVFLDYRISILHWCCDPLFGWRASIVSIIGLLEDPDEQYQQYLIQEKVKDNGGGGGGDGDTREDDDNEKQKIKEEKEQFRKEKQSGSENEATEMSCENKKGTIKKKLMMETIHTLRENKKERSNKGENMKDDKRKDKNEKNKEKASNEGDTRWTFEELIRKKFDSLVTQIMFCAKGLCNHLPTSFLNLEVVKNIDRVLDMLQTLRNSILNEDLRQVLNGAGEIRSKCLQKMKFLLGTFSLPDFTEYYEIRDFCLARACLVFCTVSSSAKLKSGELAPFELLIIDEAAQLKECESAIPLQLPGLRHAVLVGDEKQLPAMVQSEICKKADFGRSLFERLVILGRSKHLLDVQYRMHPSISLFPNTKFYGKQIRDGPNVKEQTYVRHCLEGNIFGSYSFIDVTSGKEESDDRYSKKNMVEVSVIAEIVSNLYKESIASKKKVRVGCLSPYKTQVFAIQQKLGKTYSTDADEDFSVNVNSIDGFQGGEEDVILISTVRSNDKGNIGFLFDCQRANVALTRARYCLWILGNSATLLNKESVWKELVLDSKNRGCFYDAFEDNNLKQAIVCALVELGQVNLLFDMKSSLFQKAKWKVCFSDEFLKSMSNIQGINICKEVISLLEKLSDGWRHLHKPEILSNMDSAASQLLELYDVNRLLKLIWTIDILRENSSDIQVIKVLDILPSYEISELAKKFDSAFGEYTVDYMSQCLCKHVEGDLVLPMTWPVSTDARDVPSGSDPVQELASQVVAIGIQDEPGV